MTSCVSTPKVAKFFNRPHFTECISNGDGTMFCNGEIFDSLNSICTLPEDAENIKNYYSDKEFRLFVCLKYPRKCR